MKNNKDIRYIAFERYKLYWMIQNKYHLSDLMKDFYLWCKNYEEQSGEQIMDRFPDLLLLWEVETLPFNFYSFIKDGLDDLKTLEILLDTSEYFDYIEQYKK